MYDKKIDGCVLSYFFHLRIELFSAVVLNFYSEIGTGNGQK